MKKIALATAAVFAMTSFAVAQQSPASGSKPDTMQNNNMGSRTGGSTAPGSGDGSTIGSSRNNPQAVPPANATSPSNPANTSSGGGQGGSIK